MPSRCEQLYFPSPGAERGDGERLVPYKSVHKNTKAGTEARNLQFQRPHTCYLKALLPSEEVLRGTGKAHDLCTAPGEPGPECAGWTSAACTQHPSVCLFLHPSTHLSSIHYPSSILPSPHPSLGQTQQPLGCTHQGCGKQRPLSGVSEGHPEGTGCVPCHPHGAAGDGCRERISFESDQSTSAR